MKPEGTEDKARINHKDRNHELIHDLYWWDFWTGKSDEKHNDYLIQPEGDPLFKKRDDTAHLG